MNSKTQQLKKWGHISLVIAILLNGFVLGINLYLTGLQGELQTFRYEEQYFINNNSLMKSESDRLALLTAHSNELVMLRRLAENHLTENENKAIKDVVKEVNYQAETSKINTVAITYLLSNDTTEETNIFSMFEGKSDIELLSLQKKYELQANDYSTILKKKMVKLMDDISIWEIVHSTVLVLSSIIVILGSLLIFRSEV